MDNFFLILLLIGAVAYIIYLDLLTEENIKTIQKLSNVIQQSNNGVVVNKDWVIAIVEKRKNIVAGSLSFSTSLVVFVAKVIINKLYLILFF
jgi:hypothetical protein